MQSRISVVIPNRDHPVPFVCAAIDSVLAQSVQPHEVIVVLDGSPVEVEDALLTRYGERISVERRPHAGLAATRNAGIERTTGDLVAFIDSDDVWLPHKLDTQCAALAHDPDLEAVFCRAEQFYDESADEEYRRRHPITRRVLDVPIPAAMLIRRDAFDRVGRFDESLGAGADLMWPVTARSHGLRSLTVPEVLYRRRLHHGNSGITDRDELNRGTLLAVKKHLDLQRAKALDSPLDSKQE